MLPLIPQKYRQYRQNLDRRSEQESVKSPLGREGSECAPKLSRGHVILPLCRTGVRKASAVMPP